jgi:nicotinic acid mononucleotide adenylyltransferase
MAELIDHTIVFTIARMNPPTPGHLLLINELIKVAESRGLDSVYVLLSSTKNNSDNPLSCEEKKEFLDKMIMKKYNETSIKVITVCTPSGSPLNLLNTVINDYKNTHKIGMVKLFMIIGEDRASMLSSLSKSYLKRANISNFQGTSLARPNMNQLKTMNLTTVDSVSSSAISASFIRRLVIEKNVDLFNSSYGELLDEDDKLQLFQKIQQQIKPVNRSNTNKKRKANNKNGNNKNGNNSKGRKTRRR